MNTLSQSKEVKEYMFTLEDVRSLLEEADDHTLSITLEVNPGLQENQATTPAWRIWLKNALKDIEKNLAPDEADIWRDLRDRLDAYFQIYIPQGRGLALYLGPDGFQREYELSLPFQNRAVFGPPVVAPLIWALDEYERYLVVRVDSEKAQFLEAFLGGAGTEESITLDLDTSDWREKVIMPPTSVTSFSAGTVQGSLRDRFEDRVNEHIERFHREVATRAQKLADKHKTKRIIIGGTEESAHAVRSLLPETMRQRVIAVLPLPLRAAPHEVMELVLPTALEYERQHELELVNDIIGQAKSANGRGALGREAVMEALEQRRVETVLVPWPLADEELRMQLPLQAFAGNSDIEMVRGEAAEKLQAEGGMAARLYYTL